MQNWRAKLTELGLLLRADWAWYFVDYTIAEQGWKIHVSCIPSNAVDVLRDVVKLAGEHHFSFKVVASLAEFMNASNALANSYSQKGKFITIYPRDYPHFLEVVASLGKRLRGTQCYSVPFDVRIPDTPVFYRYGAMSRNDGKISDPDGNDLVDNRESYKPDFVNDPIKPLLETLRSPREFGVPSFFDSFKVTRAVSQRGRGGNYIATAMDSDQEFFVKEGRLLGEHDHAGLNGLTRIENDAHFAKFLYGCGVSTLPVVHHSRNLLNTYLVFPWVQTVDPFSLSASERERVCYSMIDCVRSMHRMEVQHNDIKLENFLITSDAVFITDFETSQHSSWENYPRGGTVGYLPKRRKVSGFKRDHYCLAVCICFLMSGYSVQNRFRPGFGLQKLTSSLPFSLRSYVIKALRFRHL